MDTIEVNVVSKEIIKPSSPTPSHLRRFNLSTMDQLMHPVYIPMIYYYYVNHLNSSSSNDLRAITSKLKLTLSQTLTHFYPLAGRVRENLYVECNDEGALFSEAHVDCRLEDFLNAPNLKAMDSFIPSQRDRGLSDEEAVQVAVQVNLFSCGGVAIGVCFLHKLVDGTFLGAFMKRWASISSGSYEIKEQQYSSSDNIYQAAFSLFPARLTLIPSHTSSNWMLLAPCSNSRAQRYVFSPDSLSKMKARAASVTVPNPTSVEVVTAFIVKHAKHAEFAKSRSLNPSSVYHAVNIRSRVEPILPPDSIGNLVWRASAHAEQIETTSESRLVELLRSSFLEINSHLINRFQGENGLHAILEQLEEYGKSYAKYAPNCYVFTDWCKLRSYDVDFGWGQPVWVGTSILAPVGRIKNLSILVEGATKGGVEVWLILDEEEMTIMEHDQEFLRFASINPPIA